MANDPPIYTAKRQFHLPVFICRHPIRIAIWAVFVLLFFHDLRGAFAHDFLIIISSLILFFALPALVTYIEYKMFPVRFYDDRVDVRDSLLLNENLTAPYRNIVSIKKHQSVLQKIYGVETICLKLSSGFETRKTRDFWFRLEDLKPDQDLYQILTRFKDA